MYNIFKDNVATGAGGALYLCDGLIEHNIIGDEEEPNSAATGGAIAECDGTMRMNRIIYNEATGTGVAGGAVYNCAGSVQQNYIAYNSAVNGNGGGLAACAGNIGWNILYQNTAVDGGAMYGCNGTSQDPIKITNNTAYDNRATATTGTGGIRNCSSYVTILNNILWDNKRGAGQTEDFQAQISGSATPTFSCMEGGPTTDNNINPADPNDDPVTDGPQFVSVTPGEDLGAFLHLRSVSECVDKGEYPEATVFRDFDDQQSPRGPSGQYGPRRDMGADEFPTPSSTDLTYWWETFAP